MALPALGCFTNLTDQHEKYTVYGIALLPIGPLQLITLDALCDKTWYILHTL